MINISTNRLIFDAAKDGTIMVSMPDDINSSVYQNRLKALHKMNRISYSNKYTLIQIDIIFQRINIERYVRISPKLIKPEEK